MRKGWLVAAALAATPLMGSAAWGAPCVAGSAASYEALGATGCEVGPVTFYNIDFITGGSAVINLVSPFIVGGEFGLRLAITSASQNGNNGDVLWTYNATSTLLINDAFASLNGSGTNGGSAKLDEFIHANDALGALLAEIHLSIPPGPNSALVFFPATQTVYASKDQLNFTIQACEVPIQPGCTPPEAFSSEIVNAFSVVPGPIAGAGLPGLMLACGGLVALARRRRRQQMA